jgi:predicted transcriptional regulator
MNKNTKYTTLRIEEELHSKLKILSIVRNVPLQNLLQEAVWNFIKENDKEIKSIKDKV